MANLPRLRYLKANGLDHRSLKSYLRVGLRRGTWAGLSATEKALYRCGLWATKVRGGITNMKLLVSILGIIIKLLATVRDCIYRLGLARAQVLWKNYVSARVFEWAPEAKPLFSQAEYITYLGAMEANG